MIIELLDEWNQVCFLIWLKKLFQTLVTKINVYAQMWGTSLPMLWIIKNIFENCYEHGIYSEWISNNWKRPESEYYIVIVL